MCGITGWVDWQSDLGEQLEVIRGMTETLTPRGPDDQGNWLDRHCALGHRRLSVIDPEHGAQPMRRSFRDEQYTLVYNGELYNALELRQVLQQYGHTFQTECDTEVLLLAYLQWGRACLDRLTGIFAFAIWEQQAERLFLARDRVGVKPLFYTLENGRFYFGSEPKAILAHPDVSARIDTEGLAEIFAISPARTPGHGIFKNMFELKPGYCATYSRDGLKTSCYWRLQSKPHLEDIDTTARQVYERLKHAVESQLISDVPICTLLSGGLDSSAITAFASHHYQKLNKGSIPTYSVDYTGNAQHFKQNDFQPAADTPWIKRMVDQFDTHHHFIEFDSVEMADSLEPAMLARDFPGMADVDSSLYLFCKEIKKDKTVALSGEGADEVFGGYPWFHRSDGLHANTFPWSLFVHNRVNLLADELVQQVKPEQYVAERYQQALGEVPRLPGENKEQRRMRELSYLNITRFMPTLLDRKDRMSMATGLEVRVPFCDHQLIEYVWNIPWEMKTVDNREKGILRKALVGVLPEEVLYRKKSPYPKTHDPRYLAAVKSRLLDILDDRSAPLHPFIHEAKLRRLAAADASEFNLPWFGQLMSGPQLFAFLIQVNSWLLKYKVAIV